MSNVNFETGHVGLNVNDLARSKEFYTDVFGFEVRGESIAEDRKYAMLASNGKLVLTLWQQSAGEFSRETAGLHHLSFQAESVAQVEAFHAAGLTHGGKSDGAPGLRTYHPEYYAAFLLDPEGNRIEAVFHRAGADA